MRGFRARASMADRGANGFVIRAVRSRPARIEFPADERDASRGVYMRSRFGIVRAIVAADPNQTITSAQEPARRAGAWSVEDASELYQVNAWGKGYFCVNSAGHLVVRPDMDPAREIDLFEVV